MIRNKYILLFSLLVLLVISYSCSQDTYPFFPLENPVVYSGSRSLTWTIFEDSLNTLGGDVMYFPSDPGFATMSLTNINDGTAYSGDSYFKFKWNGQPIYWEADPPDNPTDSYEHSFAGISLIVAVSPEYYDETPALDLSEGNYTRVTFYIRGALASGYKVKVEGPSGALVDNIIPTSTWTKYEMSLGDLHYVKDFFLITIAYPAAESGADPGAGGYVDFDLIMYER